MPPPLSAEFRPAHRHVHPLESSQANGVVGRTARNLAAITAIELPVPPGFAITADARGAQRTGLPEALVTQIRAAVSQLEARTGKRFGDSTDPLLVAVRADPIGDAPRVPVALHVGLPGRPVAPMDQLLAAIDAVWDAERADVAVIVQAMVSGSRDARSGSGVVFTRDPATGSPGAYGRFLAERDGDHWRSNPPGEPLYSLRHRSPDAFDALEAALPMIETGFRDMCEVRFTIESGALWILQARPGRRDATAAVRIAVELVDEGLIGIPQALDRVPAPAVARLQSPVLATDQALSVLMRGKPGSLGVGAGRVVLDGSDGAAADPHDDVVLVCDGPAPMLADAARGARAIVTAAPDGTRKLVSGPPAVSVPGLRVDPSRGLARAPGGRSIAEGDRVTVDGGAGLVVKGDPKLVAAQLDTTLARLLDWCDGYPDVTVVTEVPPGHVAIDLGAPEIRADLAGAVQAAVAGGAGRLALRVPLGGLDQLDPHPPRGPWAAVVAAPEEAWAARLVAARLARRLEFPPSNGVRPADPDVAPA